MAADSSGCCRQADERSVYQLFLQMACPENEGYRPGWVWILWLMMSSCRDFGSGRFCIEVQDPTNPDPAKQPFHR